MTPQVSETIKEWNAFDLTALPLRGARPVKGLKRGRLVSAGELIAIQREPGLGDVQAATNGLVEEINEIEIIIRRDDQAVGRPPDPLPLKNLCGADLARALTTLGLDVPAVQPCSTLILSFLDPEPGLTLAPALIKEHRETVLAGLEAAGRVWPGHRLIHVVEEPFDLPMETEVVAVNRKYPFTLPALLKKTILGVNDPNGGGVLTARDLFLLGRVWRTGRPLTISPLTLGRSNYFIPLGARVVDLLTFANLMPGPDDAVVLGGLVQGRTLGRLERGLDQNAAALHLFRGVEKTEPYEPCRDCGDCARACPIGLPIDRFAGGNPRHWPDRIYHSELAGCLSCGACALACPVGRPLLSLARLMTQAAN